VAQSAGVRGRPAAGETAMEVISALRRYKSEHQLPLNEDLESVAVYGDIDAASKTRSST